jgi:hypothetical protein
MKETKAKQPKYYNGHKIYQLDSLLDPETSPCKWKTLNRGEKIRKKTLPCESAPGQTAGGSLRRWGSWKALRPCRVEVLSIPLNRPRDSGNSFLLTTLLRSSSLHSSHM